MTDSPQRQLINFCIASQKIEEISKNHRPERRRASKSFGVAKNALLHEMQVRRINCVHFSAPTGRSMYARVVHKRKASGDVSVDRIIRILQDLQLQEKITNYSEERTLDQALYECIYDVLYPITDNAILTLTTRRPAHEPIEDVSSIQGLHSLAARVYEDADRLTSLKKENHVATTQFVRVTRETHDSVSEHLKANKIAAQDINFGSGHTYSIQRVERTSTRNLTPRTLVQILKTHLPVEREAHGIPNDVGRCMQLQDEKFLRRLEVALRQEVERTCVPVSKCKLKLVRS